MDGSGAAQCGKMMALDGDAENDVDILYVNTGVGNEALLVNGNCGQAASLDEDGFPIRRPRALWSLLIPRTPTGEPTWRG